MTKLLQDATEEEMEAELIRRDELKRASTPETPVALSVWDTSAARKLCKDYVQSLAENGYVDEDFDHYIFEAAMECFFGKDVWKWINKKKAGK